MIRLAYAGDQAAWLQLRNDAAVRFWAGSSQAVRADEHAYWFERALESPQHLLLVDVGEPIRGPLQGWARVEIKTIATVSVAVRPESRGKGIGTALLRELRRRLEPRVVRMPVGTLRALVHPSNIASVQAFFKAGYAPTRDSEGFVVLERSVDPGVVVESGL